MRIWMEWKMFETSIFCDKCGCGFSFPNVEPKWFMTKIARQKGWTIGKRHLCPGCNNKNRMGEVNRMSEICDKCLTCHWYCDDVLEECKGQEEPCHEYSPCMEIRRAGEQNE